MRGAAHSGTVARIAPRRRMSEKVLSTDAKRCFQDVEARRSPWSRRRMSPGRRLYYFLGLPLLRLLLRLLYASCRIERVIGAERADRKSTRLNSSHVKISYAVFC